MNAIKKIPALLITLLMLMIGCKKEGVDVFISGQITPYNPDNEYTIRIINPDHYENNLIAVIEHDEMPGGNVKFSFRNNLNFKEILEVNVNDTVRCILTPTQGDYLKNRVSNKLYRINVGFDEGEYNVAIYNIDFDVDFDADKVLDYNPKFITPVLSVDNNYTQISGELDSIPFGSSLHVLTDGGENVEEYNFSSKNFNIKTDYKTQYINIYIKSRYGWVRHLKQYEIERLSLKY